MLKIENDMQRAKEALEAAERYFKEEDIVTAANMAFVACENAVYVLLKIKFGSTSLSRKRILTKLKDIDQEIKKVYDKSYDLRVQADYGRQAQNFPLTKENIGVVLIEIKKIIERIEP